MLQGFRHQPWLKGEVALRLRSTWERNSVTIWNNDTMQPYILPR